MNNSRFISLSIATISVLFFMLSLSPVSNAQTLYSCVSPEQDNPPFLRIIDPNTGTTTSSFDLTLPGFELRGCNGLAKDPTTGTCYMMLSAANTGGDDTPGARLLAILNPFTGQIKLVGNTGQRYAGIAFDNGGQLYGLTGDQGDSPNPLNPATLFTINKNTGASTSFLPLVIVRFGEALGFNPNDGLLYRLTHEETFQSIDPDTKAVTTIPFSGDEIGEPTALTHISGNVFYAAGFDDLYTLTTNGVSSFVSDLDHDTKGLAFDCGIPTGIARPIPTLSEWGLIAMAGVLGIVGLLALRRRRAIV